MPDNILSYAFFLQTLRITIPYLLPSLGAVYSEKGGVINIALEGILMIGAFFTALGTYYTQSVYARILFGILAGTASGGLHCIASITFKANQIVKRYSNKFICCRDYKFFCKVFFNSSSNSARIPGLKR
jgi:simple sugar transport system permease protein